MKLLAILFCLLLLAWSLIRLVVALQSRKEIELKKHADKYGVW